MRTKLKAVPKGRAQLSQVLQFAGDLITVDDVTTALQVGRREATKLLARWNEQGYIQRLRPGTYAFVPLASPGQSQVLDDPWVVVPTLFAPAYVGGWSAAEHWALTAEMFRGVCVLTTRPVRGKEKTIQGVRFLLTQVSERAMFATKPVWRGRVKVDVSSPAKTIIDMIDNPSIGGGIRHVGDCLNAFLRDGKGSPEELISAAELLGNGAVFKRLGFLTECLGGPEELIAACRQRLTTGNSRLDPAVASPRLVKRWRLWIPFSWLEAKPA